MPPHLARRHVGIGMQAGMGTESLTLARPRRVHSGANHDAGLDGDVTGQVAVGQGGNPEMDIDAIEQRP